MNNQADYQYSDLSIGIDFFNVVPGLENEATSDIIHSPSSPTIFKVLGTHDFALISSWKNNIKKSKLYKHIIGNDRITGVPYSKSTHDTNTAARVSGISKSNLIALIFLKKSNDTNIPDALKKAEFLSKTKEELSAIPIRLSGKSEIGILVDVRSNNIEDLFDLVAKTRSDTAFSSTSTMLFIRYQLITDGKLDILSGKTTGEIKISCTSHHESTLKTHFITTPDFECREILGSHDLSLITTKKIQFSELIKKTIEIRRLPPSGSIYSTSTQIGWPLLSSTTEKSDKGRDDYLYVKAAFHKTLEKCFDALARIEKKNKGHFSNGLISSFLMKAAQGGYDQSISSRAEQFWPFLNYQILSLLNKYADELETRKDTTQSEQHIFTLIHYGGGALRQLISSDPTGEFPFGLSDDCYGGVNETLEAAHKFIRHLYSTLGENKDVWSGTVFFSQFHSFGLYPSEIMSFSSESLSRLVNRDVNWLTVTHEISHSYWTRLMVWRKKAFHVKLKTGEIIKISLNDIASGAATKYGYSSLDKGSNYFKDMLWEWFAHWFDFRHFYASKPDIYLWAIWSSWLRLPLVRQGLEEYFVRSFVIFLTAKNLRNIPTITNDPKTKTREIAKTRKYFEDSYEEMIEFIDKISPVGYNNEHKDQAKKLKFIIARSVAMHIKYVSYFEHCFYQKNLFNFDPSNQSIKSKISTILSGTPLQGEKNILGVALGLLDHFRLEKKDPCQKVNMAFLDTLLLSQSEPPISQAPTGNESLFDFSN